LCQPTLQTAVSIDASRSNKIQIQIRRYVYPLRNYHERGKWKLHFSLIDKAAYIFSAAPLMLHAEPGKGFKRYLRRGASSEQARYDLLLGMARPEKSILWKVASATAVTVGDR
jgi:hypothetical protein